MNCFGYLDRVSAEPSESIGCMLSSPNGPLDVDLVRLTHGDRNGSGPGFKSDRVSSVALQRVDPGQQGIWPGSCFVTELGAGLDGAARLEFECWFQPSTVDFGSRQGILSMCDAAGSPVLTIALESGGAPSVTAFDAGEPAKDYRTGPALERARWYLLTVRWSTGDVDVSIRVDAGPDSAATTSLSLRCDTDLFTSMVLGATQCKRVQGQWRPVNGFNGKVEDPVLRGHQSDGSEPELLRRWKISPFAKSNDIPDSSGSAGPAAHLVNWPMRGVVGRLWSGDVMDFRSAPEEYAALHFHSDDLASAGWTESARLDLPADLPSGVYAVRVTNGVSVDHIPFVVTPRTGGVKQRVLLLLPWLTYAAYANERLHQGIDYAAAGLTDRALEIDDLQRLLDANPAWGSSLYDRHPDGSGICYSSLERPVPNLRPDYRMWLTGAPRHLGADLYIVDWLTKLGVEFDVATDYDLERTGSGMLDGYSVVLTGTHPEYVTVGMLDSLQEFHHAGGALMYLGGNGFYWVTTVASDGSSMAEVRRGHAGTRAWEGNPGEGHHSMTGEPGGLWRHRARPPNQLVGVGMASQGWDNCAPGYRQSADRTSLQEQCPWLFRDIADGEILGDFGLVMGGAAGDEIDRFDVSLGSPADAIVVASSTGHSDYYQLVVEDIDMVRPGLGGRDCDAVRSDIVLWLPESGAGPVFSVGSIAYAGALSHNDYANNISYLTRNVLMRFIDLAT